MLWCYTMVLHFAINACLRWHSQRSSVQLGLQVTIFSASICGIRQFHRISRGHWNNWGWVHVLHYDFFSTHRCEEQTTCPHKIAVTCVNVRSRLEQTGLRRAVFTFWMEKRNSVSKMDLDKLDFFPSKLSAETSGKNHMVYTVQKKSMFVAESSADTCGKNYM